MATTGAWAAGTEKETELNARQAFAAARYDEAIELFARLYAETLNPIYLRNIARCHQKKREPDKAIDAFREYLSKGKSVSSSERKEIQGYIKEMERLRDDQAKEAKERQAEASKPVPAPAPTPPGTSFTPPGPTASPTAGPATAAGAAPGNLAPPPNPGQGGWPYGAPPPGPGGPGDGPVLIANNNGGGGAPPAADDHPVYTRWWFWAAIGVVVAGGVAAALLIPGGVSKPLCTPPARCQ